MKLRNEIPRYHSIAHTLIKKPGLLDRKHYVLYVLEGEECRPVPFKPLIDYFLDHGRSRSAGWQREVARAVGLFIDFLTANRDHFRSKTDRPQVLAAFAEAMVGGTIDGNGDDPSGLYWEPKSTSRCTLMLNALTVFSDWLVNKNSSTSINPWRQATVAEQITYWRRFDQRRASSLLSHTFSKESAIEHSNKARTVTIRRKSLTSDIEAAKSFPELRIWDLINQGFVVKGKSAYAAFHERLNIRDMMITILLHGGGLRESEPFHLYVSDIAIDPNNPKAALVRLYHPEQGKAPEDYIDPITGKYIDADREKYLRVKWQMEPRNLAVGRLHAGWKELKLTNGRDKYALVHWFPSYWGEVFMTLFRLYITKLRSRHCQHPFLFVSHKAGIAGDPYTVDAFRQYHAKAVRRIGLVARKDLGTTPHGHRHAFAQLLNDNKVGEDVIQSALHHKSVESQNVYKEPTAEKMNVVLRAANEKMASPPPNSLLGELVV
jgi:integrase